MKMFMQLWFSLGILAFHLAGGLIDGLSYDYSATTECLNEPLKPQYGGGITLNPELDNGLKGWSTFAGGEIEYRESNGGNKFIVSHSRNQPYHSLSQKLYLQNTKLYTFSAWVQVSEGEHPITVVFKTVSGYTHAGSVFAKSGCWSMLKGGLTVNVPGPAELYFETKNTSVEIWVDSVSLQPFTEEEWRSHQNESIEKARKRRVKFHAVDAQGNPLGGAKISIKQTKSGFPLGCAMTQGILTNTAYQNWFTSRFSLTTFENEMKWYSTEPNQGREDYSVPDAMLAFAKQHGIAVRGHNVFWDDPQYQQQWVKSLSPDQLTAAAEKRITSVMSRYKGQLIAWDVVNENMHFSFFESKLGSQASVGFYQRAQQLDPQTLLFLNDYNTLEEPGDPVVKPDQYLARMRRISGVKLAIGLEGHFHTPNIPYMRSALDILSASGFPIWLTEVDVSSGPNQARYLDQVLREAHAHPAVKGIVIWGAWHPEGCYRMCLTDNNFKNLPTGDVVDKVMGEWKKSSVEGATDSTGDFETLLFHGDYDVIVSHPSRNATFVRSLNVDGGAASLAETSTVLHVEV